METKQLQTPPAEARENIMGTMAINPLLVRLSVPMMISMLVQALYNVVDSVFVSRVSESALTAVSVLVFFQLVQFAAIAVLVNLFGDGFTAWSSLTGVQAGNAIFAVALVCELIVCVIFYLVTYFFLTRKLNLE